MSQAPETFREQSEWRLVTGPASDWGQVTLSAKDAAKHAIAADPTSASSAATDPAQSTINPHVPAADGGDVPRTAESDLEQRHSSSIADPSRPPFNKDQPRNPAHDDLGVDLPPAAETHRLKWWGHCLVVFYTLSLLVIGLGGDVNVLTYHEALAAEPAREMLDGRGMWSLQTIGGQVRANKPPGMSWLIAGSMAIFGGTEEWIARLPAALSGVAVAWMIAWLGARWLGRNIGIVAGLIQGTMLYTQFQARLAEADMALAACVCGALILYGLSVIEAGGSRGKYQWRSLAFYLLTAFSMLLKGPVGPLFILASAVCHGLICGWRKDERGQRNWAGLKFLWDWKGLVLMLVLVLGWISIVLANHPEVLDTWKKESAGRFAGSMQEDGKSDPWFAYVYLVPWILLPWTPLVAAGLWRMRLAKLWASPMGSFIACWVIPGMVILSLSAWKHRHYAIPLMPILSLPAAAAMIAMVSRVHRPGKAERAISAGAMVLAAIVAGVLVSIYSEQYANVGLAIIALLLVGGLIHLALEVQRKPMHQLVAILATAWLVSVASRGLIMPKLDGYRSQTEFAQWAASQAQTRLVILGEGESQLYYYLPKWVRRTDDLNRLNLVLMRNWPTTQSGNEPGAMTRPLPVSRTNPQPSTTLTVAKGDVTTQPDGLQQGEHKTVWIIAAQSWEADLAAIGKLQPVPGPKVKSARGKNDLLGLYRLDYVE